MKKLVSVVLTGALLLGAASVAYADTNNEETAVNANYKDLKTTNWAYDAVNTMSQKGIVKGYNDGSFKPSNTVTYGEFIKMALISATKVDVGNAPRVNPITGAKQNWSKSYYDKALGLNYFGSTDIKEDQLNYPISRSDMALIISSILGETKIDNYDELEESLKDVDSTVKHDYDIVKAYGAGIITGYQDSTFKPEKTLTRAESATVIYRFVDESKRVMPEEKKEEVKTESIDQQVIISIGKNIYTGKEIIFEKTLKKAKLGDYGIAKFEVQKNGDVAIFSTVKYEVISLIIDSKMMPFVCNANGTNYWHENGYYIYLAEPQKDGVTTTGKVPTISVGEDFIIEFTNITL